MAFWVLLAITSALVVHLVPHSHVDLGWLKTIDEYYTGCSVGHSFESVRTTLSSVVAALLFDSLRRFIFAEVAFFKMWWDEQTPELKFKFRSLVHSGQFEFVGGGWSSPDEATTEYWELIELYTLGHELLSKEFGVTPTISWQIDSFGHSAQVAELLSKMGFTAAVINRVHYKDKQRRKREGAMEFMWQPFNHTDSRILTHILYDHYSSPTGLDFDDPYKTRPFSGAPCNNAESYANRLIRYVLGMQSAYPTKHLLVPMGDDFAYTNAELVFQSLDGLRNYINSRPELDIEVRYSSLGEYFEAVRKEQPKLQVKFDDFFPYADEAHSYWTGFYTSRPYIKEHHRSAVSKLRTATTLIAYRGAQGALTASGFEEATKVIQKLREAVALMCHHDTITGTSRVAVLIDIIKKLNSVTIPVLNLIQVLSPQFLESEASDSQRICQINPYKVVTLLNRSLSPRRQIVKIPTEISEVHVTDSFSNNQNCEVYKTVGIFSPPFVMGCLVELRPLEATTLLVYRSGPAPLFYAKYEGETLKNNAYQVRWHNSTLYVTHQGTTLPIEISYNVYYSSAGDSKSSQASGAYIFRPDGPSKIHCEFKQPEVLQGQLQATLFVKCEGFTDSIGLIIRIKKQGDDLTPSIVHQVNGLWGNYGKELVVVYNSPIEADSFITDTNSLHNITRVLNSKPDFPYNPEESVAGNYYPITSYIQVKDTATQEFLAVVTNHAQGASAQKGRIEVMLQRACNNDDGRGLIESMSEKGGDGKPISHTTVHRLVLGRNETQIYMARLEAEEPFVDFYGIPNNNTLDVPIAYSPLDSDAHECSVSLDLKTLRRIIIRVLCRTFHSPFDLERLLHSLLPADSKPIVTELSLNEQKSAHEVSQRRDTWLSENPGDALGKARGVRVFRIDW